MGIVVCVEISIFTTSPLIFSLFKSDCSLVVHATRNATNSQSNNSFIIMIIVPLLVLLLLYFYFSPYLSHFDFLIKASDEPLTSLRLKSTVPSTFTTELKFNAPF